MTKIDLQKFTRIESANLRLVSAVERIELALSVKKDFVADKELNPELAKKLELELVSLRSENARLKTLNETISERLDEAIGQLEKLIEDL